MPLGSVLVALLLAASGITGDGGNTEYAKSQKPGDASRTLKKAAKIFLLLDEGEPRESRNQRQNQLLSLIRGFLEKNEIHLFLEMCCWCTPLKQEFARLLSGPQHAANLSLGDRASEPYEGKGR